MTRTQQRALCFILFSFLVVTLAAMWVSTRARTPIDWVAQAREQALQPCFQNAVFVNLQTQIWAKHRTMSEAERAALVAAGRVIPEGHHEGIIIPENCFVVTSGLFGFVVTFWQRPRDARGDYDMSIPYWTPAEDQSALKGV